MRGFKKAIKYAAAIATAGAMVGAGILAGMAYNLGDLPQPFVNDKGQFDAYIVVGANAQTSDVVGAITVGAAFAQKAVTAAQTTGTSYTGAKVYNENLGSTFGDSVIGSWIIPGLADNKAVNAQNEDNAQYSEKVIVGANAFNITTYDQDTNVANPTLFAKNGSIAYEIKFNSNFDPSKITEQNPLNINILGEPYKIIKFGSNYMTVRYAKEYMMSANQSVTVDGHTVQLSMISSDSAVFNVDGHQYIVSKGVSTMGPVKIDLKNIFYNPNTGQNLVDAFIGEKLDVNITTGDKYNDNDNFVWYVDNSTNEIAVQLNTGFNLTNGGSFAFPNKYLKVDYNIIPQKYSTLSVSTNNGKVVLSAPSDKYYLHVNGYDANSVSITNANSANSNLTVTYNDETNYVTLPDNGTVEIGTYTYGNTEFEVNVTDADTASTNIVPELVLTNMNMPSDQYVISLNNWAPNGTTAYGKDMNDVNKTVVFKYGDKLVSPKSNLDNNKVVIDVPADQVKANIAILGPGSSVVAPTNGVVVNPIDVNMAQLDTSMATVDKPVILVGGPAVNKLVAQLANANKTMSLTQWRTGNMTDKAIIQYVEDAFGSNPALIIAGYSAKDTVLASKVVAAEILHNQYAKQFANKTEVEIYSQSGEMNNINFE